MTISLKTTGQQPAFSGWKIPGAKKILRAGRDGLDRGMEGLYNNKYMQKSITWAQEEFVNSKGEKLFKFNKIQAHQPALYGTLVGGLYIANAYRSDKIPKERKAFYAINVATLSTMGIAGGYLINRMLKRTKETAFKIIDAHPDKATRNVLKTGLKSGLPLLTFAVALRYLAPITSTPISEGIKKIALKTGLMKKEQFEKVDDKKTAPASKKLLNDKKLVGESSIIGLNSNNNAKIKMEQFKQQIDTALLESNPFVKSDKL